MSARLNFKDELPLSKKPCAWACLACIEADHDFLVKVHGRYYQWISYGPWTGRLRCFLCGGLAPSEQSAPEQWFIPPPRNQHPELVEFWNEIGWRRIAAHQLAMWHRIFD